MRILFAASEVAPFAKTGGLADVAASLPRALGALGHDARIVLPLYRSIERARHGLTVAVERLPVPVAGGMLEARVWQSMLPRSRVPVYFIEQARLFDREGLYQVGGADHPDNLARFSYFSQATLRLPGALDWSPEILHAHDWQTALACVQARTEPLAHDPALAALRTVLTIHNLAYQGIFPRSQWAHTLLPEARFAVEGLEFYGQINCLKGGLLAADALTTVSPTYAQEIRTPAFGCGLEGLLTAKQRALTGILNGIDLEAWNPETDPHLAASYSVTRLAGKAQCKAALQRQQQLPEEPVLLLGAVQRLAEQKGIELLLAAMEALVALPVQLVLLGEGDARFESALRSLAARHPTRVAVTIGYDDALAHQIEAGADAFLMPSRFEPCGLNQMYSMRYGTIPIVRRVGGLADTVTDLSPKTLKDGTATGIVFTDAQTESLLTAVARALDAFASRKTWTALMRQGMTRDFSWARSARAYEAVYQQVKR